MSPAKLVTGFVSIALVLMAPAPVRSQTCTSDADCSKGFRCQTEALATRQVAPCFVADGGACAPADEPVVPASSCQAAACTADDDCGVDMVCHRRVSTSCTGSTPVAPRCDPSTGCDSGAEPVPAPVICTDTYSFLCTYRWELPCNADLDCGAGFTCQPSISRTCTGSAAAPVEGGASEGSGGSLGTESPVAPLDAGPAATCTVVSSYPGRCLAQTIACLSDGECPVGWTCSTTSAGTTVPVSTAPIPGPAAEPMALDAGAAPAPPALPIGTCRSPSTSGDGGERGSLAGADPTGSPTLAGDGGAATGSNTPPTPTVPPSGGGQSAEQQPVASTKSGGGCSVGGGREGLASGLGALVLFALLGLGRLRTRRQALPRVAP
jgi:MYXO-CTERM domain-containing protein